ncbi:MAG: hypothetical protein A2018_02155 [Alphaproteobacteria bacterium GWF2_58_20]|nr:MAG: hypothetical protein A2018_02155 [Alphaproteobacteria bacterium GWF2_58_20]
MSIHPCLAATGHSYRIRKFFGDAPLQAQQAGEDLPPFSFTFSSLIGQPLSTRIFSNTVSLAGMEGTCTASISGPEEAMASLSVDDGLTWNTEASVDETNSLSLSMTTSASNGAALSATITACGFSTTWNITTEAAGSDTELSFFSIPTATAYEGMPYTYNIMSDSTAAGDTITISLLEPAIPHAWLTFTDYGDWTALLSGTPPAGSGGFAPPAFTSTPPLMATWGIPYTYDFVIDPGFNNIVHISRQTGPEWLSVRQTYTGALNDAGMIVLSGVPPVESRDAPQFSSSPPLSATWGIPYGYDVRITSSGNLIWVSKITGPEWLSVRQAYTGNLNDTGLVMLSGTPPVESHTGPSFSTSAGTSAQYGMPYSYDFGIETSGNLVHVEMTSGPAWLSIRNSYKNSFNDINTMVLSGVPETPSPTNTPPFFTSAQEDATIAAGSSFTYTATAADDNPADALVLEEAATLPAWLTFTYAGNHLRSGTLSGTEAPAGTYPISLRARDGDGTTAIQSFTITVE